MDGVLVASVGVESTGRPIQADPEEEAWSAAKVANSAAGYDAYLADYPRGRFASAARIARASVATGQQIAQTSNPTQGGQVFKDCADCPEMVVIPSGSFIMGSNDGDATERPTHSVNIRSFAMGIFEVTQGQWKAIMGSNPSKFSSCGDKCPVENVSWVYIQQFLEKLGQLTGQQYRLPSEAEWEYAARAGSKGKWTFGDNESALGEHAWYSANSNGRTKQVGLKQANAFGLHDMHGNVWEWVQDCFEDNYSKGQPIDGSAHKGNDGSCFRRVLRGGSWDVNSVSLRAPYRNWNSPGQRGDYSGFRIARTVP